MWLSWELLKINYCNDLISHVGDVFKRSMCATITLRTVIKFKLRTTENPLNGHFFEAYTSFQRTLFQSRNTFHFRKSFACFLRPKNFSDGFLSVRSWEASLYMSFKFYVLSINFNLFHWTNTAPSIVECPFKRGFTVFVIQI